MPLHRTELPADILAALRRGVVIPAHPLALDAGRRLDERRQRALSRYYIDAGAGGLAVGVHTTQFAIRDAQHGLLRPVLELAAQTSHLRRRGPGADDSFVAIVNRRCELSKPSRTGGLVMLRGRQVSTKRSLYVLTIALLVAVTLVFAIVGPSLPGIDQHQLGGL